MVIGGETGEARKGVGEMELGGGGSNGGLSGGFEVYIIMHIRTSWGRIRFSWKLRFTIT